MIGMRNIVIHGYRDVNLDVVWRVASADATDLLRILEPLLIEPED
jgi:uncharacterized protein with HEPN domain